MLNSLSHLQGARVSATDGDIGSVEEALFDDRSWVLRYLVVETGNWLQGRKLLVSPYVVQQPMGHERHIHLRLNQQQVRSSPTVDTQLPVSRQQERALLKHYSLPEYWASGDPDGGGLLAGTESGTPPQADDPRLSRDTEAGDLHLRSSREVSGYQIRASDDNIGSVQDFVFDETNWTLRYLVIDTSAWWQGGRRVLVGMQWVDDIDHIAKQLHVRMTREQVRASPVFDDVGSIHREYETRLHRNYERAGYWM
jgi:uncharacterized protein YrrD